MRTNAIVVGTDGTESSHAAVTWAAREAHRRHVPLRIVHAFDWEIHEAVYDFAGHHLRLAREFAEGVAATAATRAREIAPTLTIETEALPGHAVPRLLEATAHASLLVLGTRGRGGFTGLLLGSVSRRLATQSPIPVVVVRKPIPDPAGPIVVGVDDSAPDPLLETAFTTASTQSCPLTVVHAYLPAFPPWIADVVPPTVDTRQQDEAERTKLEDRLAPWREKFPNVPVTVQVTHLGPAHALVEASRSARLLIVGSHHHRPLAASLLGSTAQQLLHHAASPIEIVH